MFTRVLRIYTGYIGTDDPTPAQANNVDNLCQYDEDTDVPYYHTLGRYLVPLLHHLRVNKE